MLNTDAPYFIVYLRCPAERGLNDEGCGLGFIDCPNYIPALRLTEAALAHMGVQATVERLEVDSDEAAAQTCFLRSPTVRVNGLDVEAAARNSRHFGIGCRTYVVQGERQGLPPQEWIEDTIREVIAAAETTL